VCWRQRGGGSVEVVKVKEIRLAHLNSLLSFLEENNCCGVRY